MSTSKKGIILSSLLWVIICLGIAALSGWITSHGAQSWYINLVKPTFNPPSWIFGPVWSVLYILIGISGGILWVHRREAPLALIFYLIQLAFNFAWSFIFFGAHQIVWAFVDIILLFTTILLTITFSYNKVRIVSWLLLPYLLWVGFACVLNATLVYLN